MNDPHTHGYFKNYFYFWFSQLSSLLGSIVVQFVIIWWITVETQSVMILSLSSFLYFLPQVIFTPIAGVLIDRWDRKKLIILVDSSQALLTFILIILGTLLSGTNGVILMISINSFRGICQAFHYPAINAVIPTMVPKDKLSRINGLNSTFNQVLQIIGPALASILLTFFPLQQVLYIDIITFLVAFTLLMMIKIPTLEFKKRRKESKFFKEFKQGFKVVKKMPIILMLIVLFMGLNFLLQPISVLFSYFINVTHNGSVLDYAFIMTLFQFGFFMGGVLMTIKKQWTNKINSIFLSISLVLIGYLFLSMSPKNAYLYLGLVFAFMGFNIPITNSLFQTLLQATVPRDKFGRVFSIYIALSWLISPLGKLTVGFIGEVVSIENIFLSSSFFGFGLLITIYYILHLKRNKNDLMIILTETSLNI
jgi:MFS transporter, DHA3 family, macrolide efflux protein